MSKRICPIHGFWEKTDTQRRCPLCSAQAAKRYNALQRDKEAEKFYKSAAWKKVRGIHLARQPLCVECGRPAKIVDHIQEIRDGGAKLSDENLQSMCVACHNAKTAEERKKREGASKKNQTARPRIAPSPKFLQTQISGGTL